MALDELPLMQVTEHVLTNAWRFRSFGTRESLPQLYGVAHIGESSNYNHSSAEIIFALNPPSATENQLTPRHTLQMLGELTRYLNGRMNLLEQPGLRVVQLRWPSQLYTVPTSRRVRQLY